MGLAMVNHRQVSESGDSHHAHHQQQGPAPHLLRPASIVHQAHHGQAPTAPQQAPPSAYSSAHSYQEQSQGPNGQQAAQLPYYAQSSAYSNPSASTGYSTNDTSAMIAANTMQHRSQYPPMNSGISSYHTPSSNSPASVPSPSGHEAPRTSVYHHNLHQPSMYPYGAHQNQYQQLSHQNAPTAYAQHAQQSQQSMTSQPSMMMSHSNPQQQHLTQQASQHAQAGIANSPRHTKIETQHNITPQLQRATVPGPLGVGTPTQNSQNGTALSTPSNASTGGVNPNAAPGPIPATTPLVVRQDQNGVQWIAFEYSRDRVKMEYTIRCDVESVHTEELTAEFKTENCVYPRACCPKENYRGNRLQYETECNTVGWALAQLNPPLRGKRGLIQRAVDSWRNSNQDPRLRSRRVRRMAKMNNRKNVAPSPHTPHMPGPTGQSPLPGAMGPGGPAAMGKPGMNGMGHMQQHHQGHHDGNAQGGDEVDESYEEDEKHHHHHVPAATQPHGQGYEGYGSPEAAYPGMVKSEKANNEEIKGLFPDTSEAKKRKFILVEDTERHQRLRVRVALQGVDTGEIPDSFRKTSAVYQRSFFPREMQSEPTTPTGSRFFRHDLGDAEDDGSMETEGHGRRSRRVAMVRVPMPDGGDDELPVPAMTRHFRGKEVRLNDLAYRMAWLQSRVFNQRPIFLQRALDSYRNKTFTLVTSAQQDARALAPHLETRVGKRKWNERLDRAGRRGDD